ncbi:MAG: glycosyltransferase family 2 protein, partial [Verrucomicrobiales bacterium]
HQLEIIFVLDGPATGARSLIQAHSPESRIVQLPHKRGPSAARNAGLQVASGDYTAFLDADDLWPTGKLLRELFLIEQPGLQGVTWQAVFGLNQKFFERDGKLHCEAPLWISLVGCGLYRRSFIETIGGFDESMFFGEDCDWFFRIWEHTNHWLLRFEVALLYRQHENSYTARINRLRPYLCALKKSLDRRRDKNLVVTPFPQVIGNLRINHPDRRQSVLLSCLRQLQPLRESPFAVVTLPQSADSSIIVQTYTTWNQPYSEPSDSVLLTCPDTAALLQNSPATVFMFQEPSLQYHKERLRLQCAWHSLFPQEKMTFVSCLKGENDPTARSSNPRLGTLALSRELLVELPSGKAASPALLFQWIVATKKLRVGPHFVPYALAREIHRNVCN